MESITIRPSISKFAIEFDNGSGITLETQGYAHYFNGSISDCADDVKAILAGADPLKDGWGGNDMEYGTCCDYSEYSNTYNLCEVIEILKSGEIPYWAGYAEKVFWKKLGLST